jgi:hypothetical protein
LLGCDLDWFGAQQYAVDQEPAVEDVEEGALEAVLRVEVDLRE